MPTNFPGPYEIRIFYTVEPSGYAPLVHQFRYSLVLSAVPDPGTAFASIDVVLAGGGTLALHTQVDALVALLKPLMSAADATIDYAELWTYEESTFNADFLSSYDIGEAGTHASAAGVAHETISTFRTTNGGILKAVILENPGTYDVPYAYADLDSAWQAFVNYVKHATQSPFYARDNGRPFTFLKAFNGQNEHLFKKRYGRI